jgi:hypothetical protein
VSEFCANESIFTGVSVEALKAAISRLCADNPHPVAGAGAPLSMRALAANHSIARGSAMECGAILDVCHALQVVDPSLYQEGKNLLVRIVAMLTKMCLRSE